MQTQNMSHTDKYM